MLLVLQGQYHFELALRPAYCLFVIFEADDQDDDDDDDDDDEEDEDGEGKVGNLPFFHHD